ncbi:MAG: ParB/RepB/Spo0J family partition protein [Clostridia bacterium]|nr:ParB/RepB/Spo0J family partition protein [Clostridia bacterium]
MRLPKRQKSEKIVQLPIEELMPNPMQPRKQFDEYALRSLASSIGTHGMLQPIAVRRHEATPFADAPDAPTFEIIAGERRWRAAKLAGLLYVPCVIRDADKTLSAELALIENLQRRDLGYFEEAEAIRNLLLMTSMPQNELAMRLSMSPSALSNKLRLLALSDADRALIAEHGLSERHARAVLRIRDEQARKNAVLQIASEGLSASESERLADKLNGMQTDFVPQKAEKPEKKKRICLIKDVRFFFNTLDRAVCLLKEAGFDATQERAEVNGGYEIRLFVPKG